MARKINYDMLSDDRLPRNSVEYISPVAPRPPVTPMGDIEIEYSAAEDAYIARAASGPGARLRASELERVFGAVITAADTPHDSGPWMKDVRQYLASVKRTPLQLLRERRRVRCYSYSGGVDDCVEEFPVIRIPRGRLGAAADALEQSGWIVDIKCAPKELSDVIAVYERPKKR